VLLDETGSRLPAILPPSGHEKLVQILQEIKKPRRYEAPPPDNTAKEQAGLLAQAVTCRFVNQDVRAAAAAIGRQAGVNVGFDYALVDQDHRIVTLDSGETTLGAALDALAKAAGLGETVAEPGRRFWILGPGQTDRVLRTTGELLWDRAVVRSYYILPLQENFGIDMVYEKLFQAVTPGEWNGDVPVARYLISTGRLVVIHDEPSQRRVAACIDNMMGLLKPQRP